MKSVLIIGMGRLGHHLCTNMAEMGNEVMIVDKNEESMQDLLPVAVMAKVGDCSTSSSAGSCFPSCRPPSSNVSRLR